MVKKTNKPLARVHIIDFLVANLVLTKTITRKEGGVLVKQLTKVEGRMYNWIRFIAQVERILKRKITK